MIVFLLQVVKSILPKLEETEVNSRPKSSSSGPTPIPVTTEDLRKSPLSSIESNSYSSFVLSLSLSLFSTS